MPSATQKSTIHDKSVTNKRSNNNNFQQDEQQTIKIQQTSLSSKTHNQTLLPPKPSVLIEEWICKVSKCIKTAQGAGKKQDILKQPLVDGSPHIYTLFHGVTIWPDYKYLASYVEWVCTLQYVRKWNFFERDAFFIFWDCRPISEVLKREK